MIYIMLVDLKMLTTCVCKLCETIAELRIKIVGTKQWVDGLWHLLEQ